MADVVITYAVENEATARQLADVLTRQGYDVWRPEGGSGVANSDTVTEQIVGAKAAIVIWSSAATASEWIRAEANIARGMKKLVQASADGNPPPIPFDAAQVASISTWLGDDAHPGWDAIRAGVAGLAGTPIVAEPAPPESQPPAPEPEPIEPTVVPVATPPEPEPVAETEPESVGPNVVPAAALQPEPEPALPAEPEPDLPTPPREAEPTPPREPEPQAESLSDPAPEAAAASLSTPAPRRGPSLVLILIIMFVLIVLLGIGYIFWQRNQLPAATPTAAETNSVTPAEPAGPDVPQDVPLQPGTEVAPPPANEAFDRQAVVRGAGPVAVRSAPTAQGFAVGQIQPGETFQSYQQDGEWWRVRTASGVTGYVPASAIQLRDAASPAQPGPTATTNQPQTRPTTPPRRVEPRVPRQRVRKENSEVMEQYCAGAGRNTPQCRRFRNSTY